MFQFQAGRLKYLMNFNNNFALFCLFIFICLNKQRVKTEIYDYLLHSHSENVLHFKIHKHKKKLVIVA